MTNNIPETLIEAVRYFADLEACRMTLAAIRWPDGIRCPHNGCGGKDVWTIKSKSRGVIWRCKACRKQFTVKVGTIFEDSPLGLDKWLPAYWLEISSKKDVSSYQLARALKVTQRTAWFMLHRIRLAMREGENGDGPLAPLTGEVEVDETFMGGKEKNKHKSKRQHRGPGSIGKVAVMGLLERHGNIRAKTVTSIRRYHLQSEIQRHVKIGSAIYSDALKSYEGLEAKYVHEVIDHAEAFVRGRVHTNGLENFWSLFKRTIYGTHHSVEAFHLDRYLDSATFRFNTRKMTDGERFAMALKRADGRRLTYNGLTRRTRAA
jgi:transposase-like protein